jgi:AcrR family transcriptional regulator
MVGVPEGHRRRIPQQERSRQRVEAILAAAHTLVVEAGSDALTMSEVATRAGIPIGSVYQYFPDKPAVLRELAIRFMDRVRQTLLTSLVGLDNAETAIQRLDELLIGYHERFLEEPDSRDIWAATQSDKELQKLDIDDSRENGRIIAEALAHLVRPHDRARLDNVCLLFAHLAGVSSRLALAVGEEQGQALMTEFRRSVRRDLEELLVRPPRSRRPARQPSASNVRSNQARRSR